MPMNPPAGWTHAPNPVGSFRRAPSGAVYRRRKGDQSPVPVRGVCAVGFSGLSVGRRAVGPGARGSATGRNRTRRARIGPSGKGKMRRSGRCARAGPRPAGPDRERWERNQPVSRHPPRACPRRKRGEPGHVGVSPAGRMRSRTLLRGYDFGVSHGGANLSTGQAQLVSFARAVAADADLVCSTRRPAPWTPWPSTRSSRPSCRSTRPAR